MSQGERGERGVAVRDPGSRREDKDRTESARVREVTPHGWEVVQVSIVGLEEINICPAIVKKSINKYKGLHVII